MIQFMNQMILLGLQGFCGCTLFDRARFCYVFDIWHYVELRYTVKIPAKRNHNVKTYLQLYDIYDIKKFSTLY